MSYDIEMTLKSRLHVLLWLSIWHETELTLNVTQRMQYFQVDLGMSENMSVLEDLVQQLVISAHLVKLLFGSQSSCVAQISNGIAPLKAFFSSF